MRSVKIQWFGHSCFKLTYDDYSIVCDPYCKDSVPGLKPLAISANEVLCSHEHSDHCGIDEVKIENASKESPFKITEISSFHDKFNGMKRGKNIIRIFEAGELKFAHLGDIGCMPEEDDIKKLSNLDAVLIPIGGTFTLEPKEARELINKINPRVVIPMHYRSETFGYDVLSTLDAFLTSDDNIIYYKENYLELSKNMEAQTAVLTL